MTAQVHSPEELRQHVSLNQDKLSVLMCKARSCRPCKVCCLGTGRLRKPPFSRIAELRGAQAFSRRYLRLAENFGPSCQFLSIYGDETPATRVSSLGCYALLLCCSLLTTMSWPCRN